MRLLLLLISLFALVGCKTSHHAITDVPVKVVTRVDTIVKKDIIKDSVYIDRFRDIAVKGESVYITNTEVKYKYLYRYKVDTLIKLQRDSIPYPVQVVKEVRKRNTYDRVTACGFWLLTLLGVVIAYNGIKDNKNK